MKPTNDENWFGWPGGLPGSDSVYGAVHFLTLLSCYIQDRRIFVVIASSGTLATIRPRILRIPPVLGGRLSAGTQVWDVLRNPPACS